MTHDSRPARTIRIGYLPLAHETYWTFFPDYEAKAQALAAKLKAHLARFGTVVETGQLIDSAARSLDARRLFQREDVDVIVLATVTYSTPDDVILDLKRFRRPTVVWNTQASSGLPADLNFDLWMLEHGVTGVPGITNLLVREDIPYFLVSGHASNAQVEEAFRVIFAAVSAAERIWGARIGLFGHTYPGMIDFGYDPTSMYSRFGVATVPILESDILAAFRNTDAGAVDSLAGKLQQRFARAESFQGDEFRNSVRLAIAIEDVVRARRLQAATMYCQQMWQNPEIGVVACVAISLLAEQGIFFTCEGDVPTALSGLVLQDLAGTAIFTEIWANDFDNDQFLMGHSGQMNLKLFAGRPQDVQLGRHPWWDGCKGRGACFRVTMPPGPVTLLSITSTRQGGWRLVTTTADILDRPPVPLGAPNFFARMARPLPEFLEQWGAAGAAHHLALAYGDWRPQLKAFAKILDVEYHQI